MFAEPTKILAAKAAQPAKLATPFFQRQVKIGSANDAAEKEADRAADLVIEGKGLNEGKPFFTAAPPPPPAINRKEKNEEEEDEIKREEKSAGEAIAPPEFSIKLAQTATGGSPLPNETRQRMEGGFGANFNNVRIHTGAQAAQMTESVNAKAFTHGSNIYFNQGYYQPESAQGQHLLAHELTHTLQQGAAVQQNQTITRQPKQVQRELLDSAWQTVSDTLSSATDWATDYLEPGIQWVRNQAASVLAIMPGYSALCFVVGQDPVSGRVVARNGLNLLRAIVNLVPFGNHFERKLTETGTLQEAGTFLDRQVAGLDLNLGGIVAELGAIWRGLGISDVRNPIAVLQRVANVFTSRLQQIVTFALTVSRYFLNLIKRVVIRQLAEFVRARTRAYPLMTVALGYDPLTDEVVERSPQNILQAVLALSPAAEQYFQQIVESGALERVLEYVVNIAFQVRAIAVLARTNALAAWAEITIENLLQPVQTFMRIVLLVAEPAPQLLQLATDVVHHFLQIVKDALLGYLGRVAAQLPGFTLLTVILGRNPFTGERVSRSGQRLLQGFFELIPGGENYYREMQESGAIDRMLAWITGAVEQFLGIIESIAVAFQAMWAGFSWADLLNPLEAFARVIDAARRPITLILAFVSEVVVQLLTVLLHVMRLPVVFIAHLLTNVLQVIGIIRRDPAGFLRNLMRALMQGFQLFLANILRHLMHGMPDWLLRQLAGAGLVPPQELTPRSIFDMVLQILGFTANRIWQKIVQKIGPERAARLQRMMNLATGVWAFVRDFMIRGPIALWEHIQNRLGNLLDLVLNGVRTWLISRVIEPVMARLLALLDSSSTMAVINSFSAIFRVIQSFTEHVSRMLQVVGTLAENVAHIAAGNVAAAAQSLERAFARAIPLVINFLASQAGLGHIGRRVVEVIGHVGDIVDRAIEWLIDRAARVGSRLLEPSRGEAPGEEPRP